MSNSTMVLSLIESNSIKGGTGTSYFQMADGVFINYDGYGVFVSNDGNQYVFDGVNVDGCNLCNPNAAYQLNGTINVGSAWDLLTTDGSTHNQLPCEEDATQRGNNYWNQYYGIN